MTTHRLLATFFGCGFAPYASGTVASFVWTLMALFILFMFAPPPLFWLMMASFWCILGLWAVRHELAHTKKQDPSHIVIDEIAGQSLAFAFAPLTLEGYMSAFVLFRLFDIVKPYPVNASEQLPHAWGVMMDDMLAGMYVILCFMVYHHG